MIKITRAGWRPAGLSTGYGRPAGLSTGYGRPAGLSTGYGRPAGLSTGYGRPAGLVTGYGRPAGLVTGYGNAGRVLIPAGLPHVTPSAALMASMTVTGSDLIWCGEKCSTTMPQALILACRRIVRSQSAGKRCHSRESTSTASPASGHHASGTAIKTSPRYSRALNRGRGRPARISSARKSPSAADRTPPATSINAVRSNADPRIGPSASSSIRSVTVQRRRCTALAMTARASGRAVRLRMASTTARDGAAKINSPLA